MEVRRLGVEGPELSVIGLGCNMFGWTIDADRSRAVVEAALDCGITHFDTAEMYAAGLSEEYLGRALGSRREETVIGTSFPTAGRRTVRAQCSGEADSGGVRVQPTAVGYRSDRSVLHART